MKTITTDTMNETRDIALIDELRVLTATSGWLEFLDRVLILATLGWGFLGKNPLETTT